MNRISIFGLGYVGVVSAGCLAKEGHAVVGVDPNKTKVDMINDAKSPIIEPDIGALISAAVSDGKLRATSDPVQSVLETDLSLICVGTPSQPNGDLDLTHIRHVCEEIGRALRQKKERHVIACRSTMLPGSTHQVVIPTLEEYSGKRAGVDFGVCINPEFMREGTAVYDFYNPPKTVIGETDDQSGDLVAGLYAMLDAPLIHTDLQTAEMVKYADNAWHAVKVTFANEIGNVCKALDIDSHKPKDVRALTYKGRSLDLHLPVLNAILTSNHLQIEHGLKLVTSIGNKKVGVLGFSFKANTDDLRESPMVELIERLLGKGYDIRIYDQNVNLAKLVGANKDYILNHIPHISQLMVASIDEVLRHAQTIVIGNRESEFNNITERIQDNQVVVDLVRVTDQRTQKGRYEGICW
jgi:GDP-mannose 6-dehydrogenase